SGCASACSVSIRPVGLEVVHWLAVGHHHPSGFAPTYCQGRAAGSTLMPPAADVAALPWTIPGPDDDPATIEPQMRLIAATANHRWPLRNKSDLRPMSTTSSPSDPPACRNERSPCRSTTHDRACFADRQ